jgi:hypothetical protein
MEKKFLHKLYDIHIENILNIFKQNFISNILQIY